MDIVSNAEYFPRSLFITSNNWKPGVNVSSYNE